jgi:large subunit ribosomal protein L6
MTEYELTIPQGVTVNVAGNQIKVSGKLGELTRSFKMDGIKAEQTDDVMKISMESPKTKEKAYLGSITAHVKNMIKGVSTGYKYKLRILYKHFPINVSIEKDKVVIKNFAGEKKARTADILEDVKVKLAGDIIEVEGKDIEKVGQTAANIELASRVKKKDIRVFQDGIFITQKGE